MSKHFHHESFGETLIVAENNGFDADGCEDDMIRSFGLTPGKGPVAGHLQCYVSDALEDAAVEYLRNLGWTVTGYDDDEESDI